MNIALYIENYKIKKLLIQTYIFKTLKKLYF